MLKTPIRHKHTAKKRTKHHAKSTSDVAKIKAFLKATTQGIQTRAGNTIHRSLNSVKNNTGRVEKYITKKPMKSMGVTLVTGLLAGTMLGYFINNRS